LIILNKGMKMWFPCIVPMCWLKSFYHELMILSSIVFFFGSNALFAQELKQPESWKTRDNLTGDWGGGRTWLKEHGITVTPRFTQFYQGILNSDSSKSFAFGSKADIMLNLELDKIGMWKGFSMNVHAEYNIGGSINGYGGTIIPINTALFVPGFDGADAFDISSFYFKQEFGKSASLIIGKVNLIDLLDNAIFMGGSGIKNYWNATFVAPPSGTVPPYLLTAMLNIPIKKANLGIWIYDPNSMVNKSVFDEPFASGVTFRGSISIPVTIAGKSGRQGFVALYSTKDGTDLEGIGDIIFPPPPPGIIETKDFRYYFNYSFNQYLYQSKTNPKEGLGIFGQFGLSDGNPNIIHWSSFAGANGTGLIPRRSIDSWGMGYFYYDFSDELTGKYINKEIFRDEQGLEIFYNFSFTPWFFIGASVQFIKPALTTKTAFFSGLRMAINL
jgi:porin